MRNNIIINLREKEIEKRNKDFIKDERYVSRLEKELSVINETLSKYTSFSFNVATEDFSYDDNSCFDEKEYILENNDKFVSHLHIPLQAGSDDVLKSMNRRYDIKWFKNKVLYIIIIQQSIS